MPLLLSILPFLLLLLLSLTFTNGASSSLAQNQLISLKEPGRANPGPAQSSSFQKPRTMGNGVTMLEMKHVGTSRSRGPEERLEADVIKVRSIQLQIKSLLSRRPVQSYGQAQIPLNSGIGLQTLNYVVTINLANRNVTLIVDTGSDLTWVQCQPCKLCYTQPEPLFDPLISPSYKSVQCHSPACRTLQDATGNWGNCGSGTPVCNYGVTYGDGSYTHGELGMDRVLLGDILVDNFVFGCGRNNRGLFGAASGLMGLGRSDLSLISQTSDLFDGVFSYCLPDAEGRSSGSLVLGNDMSGYRNLTPISFTRLGTNPQLYSFYIVNMTGMTIGDISLQSTGFGKSRVMIDSGTVITRLPPSTYADFKAEFLKQFSEYPRAPNFSILDTCFNLSAYEEVSVPTVKMQFEGGAEMSVDVTGMFYFVRKDASQVCLAVASLVYEGEIAIIGNYQQRNMRVVYDTKRMRLGFAKEICSYG